ncbi:hypothetical protein F1880_003654 [Penicillium rolfsii]|nr:hypothetical protein F1880_003654 [Penicillium rolfsii]
MRQQRQLRKRVFIATQKPIISPKIPGVCNLPMIHHLNSPAWFKAIKGRIAGAPKKDEIKDALERDPFRQIVNVNTGKALISCPIALLDVMKCEDSTSSDPELITDDEDVTSGNHCAVQLQLVMSMFVCAGVSLQMAVKASLCSERKVMTRITLYLYDQMDVGFLKVRKK